MITRIHDELYGPSSGAVFSDCERFRYRLWREWDPSKPRAVFVMMNPSTATELQNDPTIERCQRRVAGWPLCGGIEVVNIFAWRETDSRKLVARVLAGEDCIGPENDRQIMVAAENSHMVIAAWGKPGALKGRGHAVAAMLVAAGHRPFALKLNADGSPQHPLYIGYDVQPEPMP